MWNSMKKKKMMMKTLRKKKKRKKIKCKWRKMRLNKLIHHQRRKDCYHRNKSK
jgi:hypothetical protein